MNTQDSKPLPPLPPVEFRRLVGPVDEKHWRNETGGLFLAGLPIFRSQQEATAIHARVLDFGCGAGRVAIQMLMQNEVPQRYLGIDVSRKMIDWCSSNLTSYDPNFTFQHHDVFSAVYAPDNSPNSVLGLPAEDASFSLAIAHSVFTHLYQNQMVHYLNELARIMEYGGILYTTWFFFNREAFSVLASHQNCIFINERDPTQAVYYDWNFFRQAVKACGLKIAWIHWTKAPGFHTRVYLHKGDQYPDIDDGLVPPATIIGY